MKKILILGGTRLMGRLLVETLQKNNEYSVTLFNRGKTAPDLFPDVPVIKGDRETNDIEQIAQQSWDFIIDFSSYHPKSLAPLIEQIKGKVGRYIYISTVSVYDDDEPGIKPEEGKLHTYTFDLVNESKVTGKNYGPKKVACERILQEADWLDKIILRPSIVYGQYDYTERLYYWLYRVKTQQKFIVPDDGQELSNFTFVDDFVALLLASLSVEEHRVVYNATTHQPNSWLDKMAPMVEKIGTSPEYVFVPKDILLEQKETLKGGLPGWRTNNNLRYDHSKMLADFKLQLTDYPTSIQKMIAYHDEHQRWNEGVAGIRVEAEQNFIKHFEKGKL